MDYWLELYVKPTDIPLLGLSKEYVYWAGEKHSRDPAIYVSANGIRFEAITDAAHFRAVTNMELPPSRLVAAVVPKGFDATLRRGQTRIRPRNFKSLGQRTKHGGCFCQSLVCLDGVAVGPLSIQLGYA